VTAVLGILVALLYFGDLFLIFIFLWGLANAENLKRFAGAGGLEGGYGGYDFSGGYTTLEPRSQRSRRGGLSWVRRLLGSRRAGKAGRGTAGGVAAPPGLHRDEQRRVDELLAKISREGIQSLTRRERKFLQRVSKKWSGS
jgi:hypothetical protein